MPTQYQTILSIFGKQNLTKNVKVGWDNCCTCGKGILRVFSLRVARRLKKVRISFGLFHLPFVAPAGGSLVACCTCCYILKKKAKSKTSTGCEPVAWPDDVLLGGLYGFDVRSIFFQLLMLFGYEFVFLVSYCLKAEVATR